jgi:hypothetical protein
MYQASDLIENSCLDGLWVLVIEEDEEQRMPVMARAGNELNYLLGFKNMHKARQFMTDSAIEDAQPRMVVKANKGEFLRMAQENGAAGVLVDYDPSTQQYTSASSLF